MKRRLSPLFNHDTISLYKEISEEVFLARLNHEKSMDTHNITIKVLYYDLIEKVDTIIFLYESQKTSNIGMIFRSFLELSMYLKYILENDKKVEVRGRACFYWQRYNSVRIFNDTLRQFSEKDQSRFKSDLDKRIRDIEHEHYNDRETYESYIESQINSCYENTREISKRKYWFNEDGKTNTIRSLFKYLGTIEDYDSYYSKYSSSSHGLSIISNLSTSTYEVGIYEFDDKGLILPKMESYLKSITMKVLNHFGITNEEFNRTRLYIRNEEH